MRLRLASLLLALIATAPAALACGREHGFN